MQIAKIPMADFWSPPNACMHMHTHTHKTHTTHTHTYICAQVLKDSNFLCHPLDPSFPKLEKQSPQHVLCVRSKKPGHRLAPGTLHQTPLPLRYSGLHICFQGGPQLGKANLLPTVHRFITQSVSRVAVFTRSPPIAHPQPKIQTPK